MSTVFSFRLDPKNPREARAMKVIRDRKQNGFSVREIIVEALLKYPQDKESKNNDQIDIVNERLTELIDLVQIIKGSRSIAKEEGGEEHSPPGLSEQFLGAIKMTARSGLKIDK
jgi:hypothetical protein